MPRIVLGVSGGIAAYKAAELLRMLTEHGFHVQVIPTAAALRFVGAPTWAALSGHPVSTEVWEHVEDVPHVQIGREADLVIVAPATADLLARAATGRADDLLTATLLTAHCPVLYAPAMHTEMWEHPATRANVATLRERGACVLDPGIGRLTGPDTGRGRLPEPAEIDELARLLLLGGSDALRRDLAGRRVLVSAGGTREFLDPVRFLGNRSSGRQGMALALVAAARGAEVTVVAANTELPVPAGVRVLRAVTAEDMRVRILVEATRADAVVMAAAVADFRPVNYSTAKMKKSDAEPEPVALARNPDILAELVTGRRRGQVVVGFAAETGDARTPALELGREKLSRKGADLLVVNVVGDGRGFEVADNAAVILGADGTQTEVPHGPKAALAAAVWDRVCALLPPAGRT